MSEWLELRPPVPTTPPPGPWKALASFAPERSRLVAALWRRRAELLSWYPLVPVGLPDHRDQRAAPVGALLLLWERWDYAQGTCPRCLAPAFGTSWGGMLSLGSVGGVCTVCGVVVTRYIGGIGMVVEGIRNQLSGVLHGLGPRSYPGGWFLKGRCDTLIAVLQELGETDLPDPGSPEFG